MGIVSWIVLGGTAGWLASIVMKRNDQMGCITNIKENNYKEKNT